jgi:hypothetical protein
MSDPVVVDKFSVDLARKLGALPCQMEGPVFSMPADALYLDTGSTGMWYWPFATEFCVLDYRAPFSRDGTKIGQQLRIRLPPPDWPPLPRKL